MRNYNMLCLTSCLPGLPAFPGQVTTAAWPVAKQHDNRSQISADAEEVVAARALQAQRRHEGKKGDNQELDLSLILKP
jgi:hypothetical protein